MMSLRPNITEVLSGYMPARPIGQGGMASIYLYENRVTGETLAVKSLHPHTVGEKDSVTRFFHEVQASLRLDHKNIVKVLGYGDWHSKPTMVMEYVDGGDLKDLLGKIGALPSEIGIFIAYQIMKGLDYSHRLGIIHRDIKPSNILIDRSGTVKITDFGISRVSDLTRLTQSGDVLGTPAYMSPEQAEGGNLDERSDLFSTGVVLYEMLTNFNPFVAENPSITLLNIIRCSPKPLFDINPTIPYQLETIIDRLIIRNPDDRLQNAAETASALKNILDELVPDGFSQETFQEFLTDPEGYTAQRRVKNSLQFLERGKTLLHQDHNNPEAAIVEFYKSLFLDPGQIEARQYITSITEKFGFASDRKSSEKVLELETSLQKDPANVAVLLQLVKRCRADGDILKAVSFSKRLARLRPKDPYILGQINTLLPRDQATQIMNWQSERARPLTSRETTRIDESVRERRPAIKPGEKPVSTVRATKGIDPFILTISAVIITITIIALFVARQFRTASETVDREMPMLIDTIRGNLQDDQLAQKPPMDELFTGRAREIIHKAQDEFKSGNIQNAIDEYLVFLSEFPDHDQADSVRMQLARLHQGQGKSDLAEAMLDDQITKGRNDTLIAYARLRKIQLLNDLGKKEEARWECIHLEPDYQKITSPKDQISFLMIYANLCEHIGDVDHAISLYEKIITGYTDRTGILEARLLKADDLFRQGNMLEAQRELWIVRDQSRPESVIHRTALEKLSQLEASNQSIAEGFNTDGSETSEW
ncbi:protein kinase [bacterium]|nr:protein kinase [candidate division CSSED10-310 bacterium]